MRGVVAAMFRWLATRVERQRQVLKRAIDARDYADAKAKLHLLTIRAELVKQQWRRGPRE